MFGEPAPHLELPRYPWQRQRLHHEPPELRQHIYGTRDSYAMLGDPDFNNRLVWELQVSEQTLPWIADHVVDGSLHPSRCGISGCRTQCHVRAHGSGFGGSRGRPVPRAGGCRSRRRRGHAYRSRCAQSPHHDPLSPGHQHGLDRQRRPGGWSRERIWPRSVPSRIPGTWSRSTPEDFYETMTAHGVAFGPHFRRVTALRMNSRAGRCHGERTVGAGRGDAFRTSLRHRCRVANRRGAHRAGCRPQPWHPGPGRRRRGPRFRPAAR